MNDDMKLLREYAARHSEEAFETLVSRHIHLVHSSALRQVRDPHRAEDITQTVFIILARKAGSLSSKTILPGWLYRTTRYACAAALKIQQRRERREQEVYMDVVQETQNDSVWEQLSPLLDGAMAELREADRDALVLRYFQNKSLREVGAALGVEEQAAQKRVQRALEKLREIFARHNTVSTTATIAGALSAHSIQIAPALLTKSVAAIAIAKGASASGSTLTLIQGALKLMAWTKVKTAVVIGVAVAAVVTTTTTLVMRHENSPKLVMPAQAGYVTPYATLQSMLWAGNHGDVKMFLASVTPACGTNFLNRQMKRKSEAEIAEGILQKSQAMSDFHVISTKISNDSSILHVRFVKGGRLVEDRLQMTKIDGEWKIEDM